MSDPVPPQPESGDGLRIPLVYDPPRETLTRYATNFVIQCLQHEFVVSFYEAEAPILLGSSEENKAALQSLGAIHARCVARIVVAPERMKEFARIVASAMDRYTAAKKGEGVE